VSDVLTVTRTKRPNRSPESQAKRLAYFRTYRRLHPRRYAKGDTATLPFDAAERFWARVDRRQPSECWPWRGSFNAEYGRIKMEGRNYIATHVALALDGRPVTLGTEACHSCDNPPCVNPAHLFAAPHLDNVRDMVAKGRLVSRRPAV
jgi:hypothetical protein